MKYEHIIFDLDGTLLDTEKPVLLTWQSALKKYGYDFSLEDLKIVLGITPESALKQLQAAVDGNFWNTWKETYSAYAKETDFFDGVERMLQTLKYRGYALGIVTSRTKEEYDTFFRPFHLESLFYLIICSDDTKKHKPNPEPLYRYAELAGTIPGACVYIGDMPTDIACANLAGAVSGFAAWNGAGRICEDAKLLFRTPDEVCAAFG